MVTIVLLIFISVKIVFKCHVTYRKLQLLDKCDEEEEEEICETVGGITPLNKKKGKKQA